MPVSRALARIYTSAPQNDRQLETLDITHPAFTKSYFLTNSDDPFVAGGVTYEPFPFQVKLPSSGENGFEDLVVSLSNVTPMLVQELERARLNSAVPITFVYRAWAESDLTNPGYELPPLSATEIVVENAIISARVTMIDLVNRAFPNQLYTPTRFPMLANIS